MEQELRLVLKLLAARTGQELVVADLARDAGLDQRTAADYIALLRALYLVVLVPAWSTGVTTRAKRRPKVLMTDSGLAAELCGAGTSTFDVTADGTLASALFESYVAAEIHKQTGWADTFVDISHFRDRNGAEVDLVVEDRRRGLVAGVEAKLTASPRERQLRHLAMLRDRLGERFTVGILLHAGRQVLPMGERLWALPVSALWRSDPVEAKPAGEGR